MDRNNNEHLGGEMAFTAKLRTFPAFIRPFIVRFLPEYKAVSKTRGAIFSMLENKITQSPTNNVEAPGLTGYLMEKYGKLDTPNIIRDHLTMLMAATGFPVLAITHILIDLCARKSSENERFRQREFLMQKRYPGCDCWTAFVKRA